MAKTDREQEVLRRKCRHARASLSIAERDTKSARICESVIRSGYFRSSRKIACYLPSDEEVDTWPIIARAFAMGKRVSAPVVRKNFNMWFCEFDTKTKLLRNQYDLLEPEAGPFVDPHEFDVVITPLVAFDAARNRIGMGSGYFDRAFSFLRLRENWLHPKLIGVAFDCQRVDKIVANPWDIALFRIITESN
jgi:5-formyltetrahydrofolate cyclo-ligase